ncbi:MAG TPA: hypothetical protein VFA80_20900, partial [Xanthobacteraceae bacterium]|nr:hypothetical protein [Xanthobacteraceae bacterium]
MRGKTSTIISGLAIGALMLALVPDASAARGGFGGGGGFRGGGGMAGGGFRGGGMAAGGFRGGGMAAGG